MLVTEIPWLPSLVWLFLASLEIVLDHGNSIFWGLHFFFVPSIHPTSTLMTPKCRNGCSNLVCISFWTEIASWKVQKSVGQSGMPTFALGSSHGIYVESIA